MTQPLRFDEECGSVLTVLELGMTPVVSMEVVWLLRMLFEVIQILKRTNT